MSCAQKEKKQKHVIPFTLIHLVALTKTALNYTAASN